MYTFFAQWHQDCMATTNVFLGVASSVTNGKLLLHKQYENVQSWRPPFSIRNCQKSLAARSSEYRAQVSERNHYKVFVIDKLKNIDCPLWRSTVLIEEHNCSLFTLLCNVYCICNTGRNIVHNTSSYVSAVTVIPREHNVWVSLPSLSQNMLPSFSQHWL